MIIRGLLVISPDIAQLQAVLLNLHTGKHAYPKCEEHGEMIESTTTRRNRELSGVVIISGIEQYITCLLETTRIGHEGVAKTL